MSGLEMAPKPMFVGGRAVFVDDDDANIFESWKWYLHPAGGTIYLRGYKKGLRKFGLRYMHRVLLDACRGEDVDHANGNGLDNRRCNLRICSRSQNSANRYVVKSNTGYKGVHFETWSGRWRAEVQFERNKWRRRFTTREAAIEAYAQKARELFGEFSTPRERGESDSPHWELAQTRLAGR